MSKVEVLFRGAALHSHPWPLSPTKLFARSIACAVPLDAFQPLRLTHPLLLRHVRLLSLAQGGHHLSDPSQALALVATTALALVLDLLDEVGSRDSQRVAPGTVP